MTFARRPPDWNPKVNHECDHAESAPFLPEEFLSLKGHFCRRPRPILSKYKYPTLYLIPAMAVAPIFPFGTNTSNMSQNRSIAIRQTLEGTLGVTISSEWWTACCNATSNMTEDKMLSHLLVSDLRDVVRPSTPNDASQKLQEALQESRNKAQSSTTTSSIHHLPATFQLLCQLEEAVDVSLNQESRLSVQMSHHKRCLKLFLSDGTHNFVAMEIQPFLPTCTPGSKLRLQGPITIRWGILQLNSANTTFIGGQVEELVVAHAKALEQAQKLGGVGVDATIRALIGNNPLEVDTIVIDEGEGESADVPEPIQVPIPSRVVPVGGTLVRTGIPLPVATNASAPITNTQNVNISTHATTTRKSGQPILANSCAPTNTTITSTSISDRSTLRNPYELHQPTPTHSTTRNVASAVNPTTSASIHSQSSRSIAPTTYTPLAPPPPRRTGTTSNPYSGSAIVSTSRTSISNDSPIPFQQLRHILLQSVQDPIIMQNNLSRTFHVTLIQKGGNLHFNIGKEKHGGKKQYNFEIHATFGVPDSPDLIACKLPSSILEPLFPISPAELRALTRTDRPASNQIVEQGGTRIRQEFFGKLQPWHATLLPGATSLNDIQQPILMIQPLQS